MAPIILLVHAVSVHATKSPRLIGSTIAMRSRRNSNRRLLKLEQEEGLNGVPLGLGDGLQGILRPGSNGHGGYTDFQESRMRNFIKPNLDFLQNLGEYANKQENAE